jgi:hypothetical protein
MAADPVPPGQEVVGLTPGAPRPLYAEPGEPTAAEMNRDHLDRTAMARAIDRAAADLAAVYGTTPEEAAATIRRALTGMATVRLYDEHGLTPPLAAYGIAVDFRWWERPRWLWARHATKRTAQALGF